MKTGQRRTKAEGAAHVFSTWHREENDPYDLGVVDVDGKIRIAAGKIVQDNTMTAEMATEVLQLLEGEFLVKLKFIREQAPNIWIIEDGFAPLKEGRAHGVGVLEVSSRTDPGTLEGIDQLYYQNVYPVSEMMYGLYSSNSRYQSEIFEPDAKLRLVSEDNVVGVRWKTERVETLHCV